MIFVTVGHQMPFDRLIRAVDAWAHSTGRDDVFAQIGDGEYEPAHVNFARRLAPEEFLAKMTDANMVIAHAGTGTILAALQFAKPLLVVPRRARLLETRNDHQVATANRFCEAGYVLKADDEVEMVERIPELERFQPRWQVSPHASPMLLDRLRRFMFDNEHPASSPARGRTAAAIHSP